MKKNFIKLMMYVAVALPMALMTSCDKEEKGSADDPEQDKEVVAEDIKIDGESFVRQNWLNYDDAGAVIGIGIGKVLDESEPTVAYVGVDDFKDALFHFQSTVMPVNAALNLVDGNYQAVLVDTLRNEQNRINLIKVDDGKVIAKVSLQKNIGIESYITEIRYIPKSLWPENATDDDMPFKVGRVYTFKGHNYVCVSSPEFGSDGLLVCDLNNYIAVYPDGQSSAESMTANYPNVNTCLQIGKELANTFTGPRLWQLFCAASGQSNLKEFKKRLYWTSTVDGSDVMVVNLATQESSKPDKALRITFYPWVWKEGTQEWTLGVYKFFKDENGKYVVQKRNNNIWMHKVVDLYPNISDFKRNEEIEKKSESIELQYK